MITIGICGPSLSPGTAATFAALGAALGVLFERRTSAHDQDLDGWVVLNADRDAVAALVASRRPGLVVVDERELRSLGTSTALTFASHAGISGVLRRRIVHAEDAAAARALPVWLSSAETVASKGGVPVWSMHRDGPAPRHYVALSPPELQDGEPLFAHFSGQRLARLLPLVLFVRELTEARGWEPPPLQAAVMIDDPNLHWTSYGFIDYMEMVTHAVAGNYHVAVATIPLDSWFVHPPTRAVFSNHAGNLSLLYHGNNHVSQELSRAVSTQAMRRLLRQAVARIGGMEARTGLQVARVMAPPHGACSETALAEMARIGFEAVCVSRGSLKHHNPAASWTRTLGMRPCDVVADLPIIPRFGLSAKCQNDVLVAALLRQPIVPMTHHQTFADGYDLLDDTAAFINSLGPVVWRNMKAISRSLYTRRQDGPVLHIQMLNNRISVAVPLGTRAIAIERCAERNAAVDALWWWTRTDPARRAVTADDPTFAVHPGSIVEITAGPAIHVGGDDDRRRPRRLAPVARRLLTEVRDRAMPSLHRVTRGMRSGRVT